MESNNNFNSFFDRKKRSEKNFTLIMFALVVFTLKEKTHFLDEYNLTLKDKSVKLLKVLPLT
jgi:hypothetical protein